MTKKQLYTSIQHDMEKRPKKLTITPEVFSQMRLHNLYSFSNCYDNFKIIIDNDKDIQRITNWYLDKKIDKYSYRSLIISHILYYYDIDISDYYTKWWKRYIRFERLVKEKFGKDM